MPSLMPEGPSRLLSQLRADQSDRWNRGEPVRVEQYLDQHPALDDDPDALLNLIHSEVLLRLGRGEQPTLDEYVQRFPRHADHLRQSWTRLQMLCPQLASDGGGTTAVEHRTPAPEPSQVPALPALPGLELLGPLGEGGMGVVYRARDVRLGRALAVKVIRAGPFAGSEAHDRFHREAKAMAQLAHPAVVRIYSLGEHAGVLYISMELLEGGNLHARLRKGPLDLREAATLVRQVALGVQHAHERGILHRDLKPANVLLGDDDVPRVSDFGLAKLLDADEGFTQSGAVMGTPAYMAPEQAEDTATVGPAADVWALGVILYECLTGRVPFRGERRGQTLEMVRTQPAVPPRQLRPEVPAELEAICLRCLEKRPERRYASAAALADDLQAWLDGRAVDTPPAEPARRRRVGAMPLVGALLAVGLIGLFAYLFHPDRPLWRARERLRRGEAVELIGATGKPAWWRWWVGGEEAQAIVGPDGAFVVHGWPLTLVELLPNTAGLERYRLLAEVRHVKGGERGRLGLYVAGTRQAPVYTFLQVAFDDLHDETAIYHSLPEMARRQIPPPKGNAVRLAMRHYAGLPRGTTASEVSRPLLNSEMGLASAEVFRPSGHGGKMGDWRAIEIDMSPDRVRVTWAGKPLREVRLDAVRKKLEKRVAGLREQYPAAEGLEPQLDVTGGIGLYLHESYASFRNVRIEPIDVPNPEE